MKKIDSVIGQAGSAITLAVKSFSKCIADVFGGGSAYPQDTENNEYRYLDPQWLNEIAIGLTAGAEKHPGETWRDIPCEEHLARALRHINLYRMGDRAENHIINASMRLMMACATTQGEKNDKEG